jgi:hypothetical protein
MYLIYYMHLVGIKISDLMQECTKWKASKHYTTVKTLAFLIAAGPQN